MFTPKELSRIAPKECTNLVLRLKIQKIESLLCPKKGDLSRNYRRVHGWHTSR
ncbi:hypothetical protein LMED105_03210 [Limnobacter sp. MED105]|jgi:hypothetical protein|nr:hypothetical protein LMED105_03210 [Limnobacter sp. MED105]